MKNFPPRLTHPSGVQLRLERDRVVVTFDDGPSASSADDRLAALDLVAEQDTPPVTRSGAPDPNVIVNDSATRTFARTADGQPVASTTLADQGQAGLASIGPVYSGSIDGREEVVGVRPDVLIVTPSADVAAAAAALAPLGVEVDEAMSEYLGSELYCRVVDPLAASSLDIASDLAAGIDGVSSVRLELMPLYRPYTYVPNDPDFGDQWNIVRIRAGGTGHTGWNLQKGDPGIVIAVIDDGIDLNHPDLRLAGNGVDLADMSLDGSPKFAADNHGTAVAGCAAAIIGNGAGVAGVAGGCSVVPIRLDSWSWTEIAIGIRWAAQNGAHVVNMSLGGLGGESIVDSAIQEAFDAGLVLCAATGNDNTSTVSYPASNPLVIACGASDQDDERKSPSSPDGETWWGSNWGAEISVVAPGVLIPTTDRLGADGYTATNYTSTFNGTSSATPQVAGLAALLLSCDPSLTPQRVREFIETTAAKVGSTVYVTATGRPSGTWNTRLGYGRIDVEAALQKICKSPVLYEFVDWTDLLQGLNLDRWRRPFHDKQPLEEVKSWRVRELPDFEFGINERLPVDLPVDWVRGGSPFIRAEDRAPLRDGLAGGVRRRQS